MRRDRQFSIPPTVGPFTATIRYRAPEGVTDSTM